MIESHYESGLIETSGDFCGEQRAAALDHAVLPMNKIEQHLLDRSPQILMTKRSGRTRCVAAMP